MSRLERLLNKCPRSTPPALCQAQGTADTQTQTPAPSPAPAAALPPLTPNEITKNLCGRLFPDQEVMQTACRSRCSDHYYAVPGDAQECAFKFAHTSREVTLPVAEDHTVLWSVVLLLVLIPAAWFAYRHFGKKPAPDDTV